VRQGIHRRHAARLDKQQLDLWQSVDMVGGRDGGEEQEGGQMPKTKVADKVACNGARRLSASHTANGVSDADVCRWCAAGGQSPDDVLCKESRNSSSRSAVGFPFPGNPQVGGGRGAAAVETTFDVCMKALVLGQLERRKRDWSHREKGAMQQDELRRSLDFVAKE